MQVMSRAGGAIAVALLATVFAAPSNAADVTQERLVNADAEPQNWLTPLQNFSAHRYSRLNQITRDNVGDLGVAFTVPLPTAMAGAAAAGLENPPLVIDGMMYVNDGWGTVYKIDVTNGKNPTVQWVADPAIDKEAGHFVVTRGIAAYGNKIFANLTDGRVIGVDADTGEIVWDTQVGGTEEDWEFDAAEGFTAAPLATEGHILAGQSKGDWGTRGWLASLDSETGDLQWRTYTIPGPGEPGHETWKDDHNAWRTGGGSLWQTGSYDPETRVTIWGTANPVPMFDPEYRPGDNLYTNSALAFNIDDGSIAWYFQYTANESWDYDEIGVHQLIDAEVNGEQRKLVTHFGRNGFFYELDRTNGQFVAASQWVEQVTWTAGIDPKTGKPVEYDPSLDLQTYIPETRQRRADNPEIGFCPTMLGGVRWQPPAYNPDTHITYIGGQDGCSTVTIQVKEPVSPEGGNPNGVNQNFLGGTYKNHDQVGLIAGIDVTTGQMAVKTNTPYLILSGVLATPGLVWVGHIDGRLAAYNDETLQEVWSFNTGIQLKAPAISYAIGDQQYIAVLAGGAGGNADYPELSKMGAGAMLYVFSL